jgi:hypothetical protein
MPKGQKSRYSYGKAFKLNGKTVMYRYTDKKKSTKTLVDSNKKPMKSYGRRK